jgi:hypothetical protein
VSGDIVQRLRDVSYCGTDHCEAERSDAADEIERLRADDLHEQHRIGTDLARLRTEVGAADALANTLRALVAEQHDEIERLRAAGDALATNLQQMEDLYHSRTCKGMNTERIDNCTCLLALAAWQEARRER